MELRPATDSDRRLVFDWANDPMTRSASFNTDPIEWDDHVRWWADVMKSPTTRQYIGMIERVPFGVIRFQGDARTAVVSVTVGPDFRRRGLAADLIRLGTERDGRSVTALIRSENEASIRAFTAAGYRLHDGEESSGVLRFRGGE